MPGGKPAGVRCVQLTDDLRCALYGRPERPAFCVGLRPSPDLCGATAVEAMRLIAALEETTRPDPAPPEAP
jgi:hypothetical protein